MAGPLAACAAIAGVVAPGGAARADVIYELAPTIGAGATDNAAVTAMGQVQSSSSFSYMGGSARLRYRGALVEHALGYTLTYTRFLLENGPDAMSHSLAWVTSVTLSATWRLQLTASGRLLRSSGVDPANPAAVVPMAGVAGSVLYANATASQQLSYTPDAKRTFTEVLTVGHLRYLESMINGMVVPRPNTTLVSLALSGSRLVGRETLLLDLLATDMFSQFDSTVTVDPSRRGHTLFVSLLGGWRHDLSPTWSTTLQAGPSMIARFDGNGVIAPSAIATLGYNHVPWYAALIAAQTAMPNPYLGEALIADQLLARAALPLTRSERVFVGAFGGYVYARVANGEAQVDRLYDAFIGGASLTVRFPKAPLALAATYSVQSQRGSALPGRSEIADFGRQYVLISLRADLSWGPGTPPLFGGPL
jgi:hypothetical protein